MEGVDVILNSELNSSVSGFKIQLSLKGHTFLSAIYTSANVISQTVSDSRLL